MTNNKRIENLLWLVYETISNLTPEEYKLLLKNKGILKFETSSNTYKMKKLPLKERREFNS